MGRLEDPMKKINCLDYFFDFPNEKKSYTPNQNLCSCIKAISPDLDFNFRRNL